MEITLKALPPENCLLPIADYQPRSEFGTEDCRTKDYRTFIWAGEIIKISLRFLFDWGLVICGIGKRSNKHPTVKP